MVCKLTTFCLILTYSICNWQEFQWRSRFIGYPDNVSFLEITHMQTISKRFDEFIFYFILFFSCGCATDVPNSIRGGGIFGSKFRYHGRVHREILEDPGPLRASDAVISRTPLYRSLQRNKTRSLTHSPSHPGNIVHRFYISPHF